MNRRIYDAHYSNSINYDISNNLYSIFYDKRRVKKQK